MANNNGAMFIGEMPEEIPQNALAEFYVVSEVPEDTSSFYNALKNSLWQYEPELASQSVQKLRNAVATELVNHVEWYEHRFPVGVSVEELANRIREGTHHATPYVMMAMEQVIQYKIKVSIEDSSTVFASNFVSDKPTIWLRKVGPHFKGMVKVDTVDFAAAFQE